MTLAGLERRLNEGTTKTSDALKQLMQRMKGLPFYLPPEQGRSFWFEIIAPTKYDGSGPSPLWDYQENIINLLQTKKLVAVNKCRHSGMTELGIRYFLYKILCEEVEGLFLGIVATNIELAKDLARRTKTILAKHSVYFEDKETVLSFPKARIQFFPSSADNIRGFIPSAVFADEIAIAHSDFNSNNIFSTIDAFHVKNPQAPIYCITTPGRVGSGAHALFTAKNSMYERVIINYRDCLNKTFSESTLELLKQNSPSFSSEFDNKFGFSTDNPTFRPEAIEKSITNKTIQFNQFAIVFGGWDCGFSSPSAATVGMLEEGYFKILHCKEYDQREADYEGMLEEAAYLIDQYNIQKMYIDGSNPSFIMSLRERIGEYPRDYNEVIKFNKQNKLEWDYGLRVTPVAFNKFGRDMLFTAKAALEKGGVVIPNDKTELIEALRTAKDSDGHLNKKITSFNHALDSFLLALRGIELDTND